MRRMIERFAPWPRYKVHMANTPPQAYAVEQGPLRDFLKALDAESGGVRGWLVREGAPENGIEELRSSWIAQVATPST